MKRPYRPAFDRLEARDTPSTIDFRAGVVTVVGTAQNDTIQVSLVGNKVRVVDNGRQLGRFPLLQVKRIVVDGGFGNDFVSIAGGIVKPTNLYGGYGNDTIYGGGGKDQIYGGAQNDTLFGRAGADAIFGGTGTDTINGGPGANALVQETPGRGRAMTVLELEVLALVNVERASRGLAPLIGQATLAFAAGFHSSQMAARSNALGNPGAAMQHELFGVQAPTPASRLDYAGYDNWATYGENIAYGYQTAADVMTAWMNSPGHRANILSPNFTELGVGVVANAAGLLFWTQVFGTP